MDQTTVAELIAMVVARIRRTSGGPAEPDFRRTCRSVHLWQDPPLGTWPIMSPWARPAVTDPRPPSPAACSTRRRSSCTSTRIGHVGEPTPTVPSARTRRTWSDGRPSRPPDGLDLRPTSPVRFTNRQNKRSRMATIGGESPAPIAHLTGSPPPRNIARAPHHRRVRLSARIARARPAGRKPDHLSAANRDTCRRSISPESNTWRL